MSTSKRIRSIVGHSDSVYGLRDYKLKIYSTILHNYCTYQQIFIRNVTVHMCMTFSDVVFQQELCIEFPPTYVASRLLFLVVLSEVPLETNFIAKNFATILAGSFLTHVHAPQVCDVLKNFHF